MASTLLTELKLVAKEETEDDLEIEQKKSKKSVLKLESLPTSIHKLQESQNFYSKVDITETSITLAPLRRLKERVDYLLTLFTENDVLENITQLIDRILR